MSYLAVQWITIAYTDDQRGAKHATKRARLRAFPLPPCDGDGVCHEIRADVRQGLEPVSTTRAIALRDGAVAIADGFRIMCVERTLAFVGPNAWSTRPAFVVLDGAWGRVIWNAKSGAGGDQKWLVEHIVNAGRFDTPPRRNIFRGLPTVERDMRRDFLRTRHAAGT
jgi:hypothetical protein